MTVIKKSIVDKNGKHTTVLVRADIPNPNSTRLSRIFGKKTPAEQNIATIQAPLISGMNTWDGGGGEYSDAQVEAYFPEASSVTLLMRDPQYGAKESALIIRSAKIRVKGGNYQRTEEALNIARAVLGKEALIGKDSKGMYFVIAETKDVPLKPSAKDIENAYKDAEDVIKSAPQHLQNVLSKTSNNIKIDKIR